MWVQGAITNLEFVYFSADRIWKAFKDLLLRCILSGFSLSQVRKITAMLQKKKHKKTRTTKNNDCVRDISGLQPLDSRSVTPIAGENGTLSSVSTLGTSAKFLGLDTKTVCFCCNCLVDFRLQGILYIYIYMMTLPQPVVFSV